MTCCFSMIRHIFMMIIWDPQYFLSCCKINILFWRVKSYLHMKLFLLQDFGGQIACVNTWMCIVSFFAFLCLKSILNPDKWKWIINGDDISSPKRLVFLISLFSKRIVGPQGYISFRCTTEWFSFSACHAQIITRVATSRHHITLLQQHCK